MTTNPERGGPIDPTSTRVTVLCAEEEVELAQSIEAGLYAGHLLLAHGGAGEHAAALVEVAAEGRAAFTRFVAANVPLAVWHARRRAAVGATGGLTVGDLTNEGVLGVIRAVQKFDYTQGNKFSTYASAWVRQFQQRAVLATSPAALDAEDQEQCAAMVSERQFLTTELGRLPSPTEMAAAMGTTVRALSQWQGMLAPAYSLDAPAPGFEMNLGDTIAAPDHPGGGEGPWRGGDVRAVGELLVVLTDRERSVLGEVFGLDTGVPTPIAAVAAARGVAPERVTALVEAALDKLRAAAASVGEVAA